MNSFLAALVALITSLVGIFSAHPKTLPKATKIENNVSATASAQTKITTPSAVPAPPPTPTPPITHPIDVNPTGVNVNDLRYPNSTIISQGGGKLSLQSSDSPDTITKWYEQKISSLGMNANSEVITETNGNVLNSLSGGNGKTTISVKISKSSGGATVSIEVDVTNP